MVTTEDFLAAQKAETQAKLNVQPGDKWFKFNHLGRGALEVEVTKVTRTQISFSDGNRITRSSGKIVGADRFDRSGYAPATEALRAELEQAHKNRKISVDFKDAITRIQANADSLTLDKKLELINLINGFFDSL